MIIWSPSSWELWKTCPAKYRIKKIEKWQRPNLKEDTHYAKLAVPGLVVDKMLQLWLHRKKFHDKVWLNDNIEMVWSLVENEINPRWTCEEEIQTIKEETWSGLNTAIRMLEELDIDKYDLWVQPTFFENISTAFSITGSADLLMVEKTSGNGLLIDFKNAHRRARITKDQLTIYKIGLTKKASFNIAKAGYLLYNPRVEEWKWFKLSKAIENKLLERLAEATEDVISQQFDYKWNYFTCTRFCDVRIHCEMFQQLIGRKTRTEEKLRGDLF